jgi:hypothetical protein
MVPRLGNDRCLIDILPSSSVIVPFVKQTAVAVWDSVGSLSDGASSPSGYRRSSLIYGLS